MITYSGLLAPEEVLTSDGRMFAAGKGEWRENIPVLLKNKSGGHGDAVVVGTLSGRPHPGPGGTWGTVKFLDPQIVPEVALATYLLDNKAVGPSVDLGPIYTVEAVPHPSEPDKKAARFTRYVVVGVTLVPMPAFGQVHLSCDQEGERALLASAGVNLDHVTYFDINRRAWDAWPLADRQFKYDADDAVKRIASWAGIGSKTPSLDHYASAFLWRDGNQVGDSLAQDSFRLPLCDIIDGQPHLVYHAVYAAAALLSGGHGGLPNIPDADQQAMKDVINTIYAKMADAFGDSSMKSPFDPSYTNRRPESEPGMSIEFGVSAAPKRAHFENPKFSRVTKIHVTPEGRVLGHIAPWKQCHIGIGNACQIAPRSKTDYAYFRQGPLVCDDGTTVKVGKLTVGAGHANDQWGVMPSREHYDNTALCAAYVNVGEDRHGIWVSGVLTPNATPDMIQTMNVSQVSGDWRWVQGTGHEMIAALFVNNPGFPVISYRDGEVFSIQGLGIIEEDDPIVVPTFGIVPMEDVNVDEINERLDRLEEFRVAEEKKRKAAAVEGMEARRAAADDPAAQQQFDVAAEIQRQMDAKFYVLPEPEEGEDGESEDTEEEVTETEEVTPDEETVTETETVKKK
jgi:hypothetical protein